MSKLDKTLTKVEKPRELDKKGKETLTALLSYPTHQQAAQALSIAPATLYLRIDKYGLREILNEIPQRALDQLRMASHLATSVLINNLGRRGSDMQAAIEILDRVGVGKATASNDNLKRRVIAEEFFE